MSESLMGLRIKEKRIENHLTMSDLAEHIGVQASAVNKWEKGLVKNVKQSTIKKMALLFNCSPAWLMGFDDTEDKEVPVVVPEYIELVDKYSKLSEAQQNIIMQTINAFLSDNN